MEIYKNVIGGGADIPLTSTAKGLGSKAFDTKGLIGMGLNLVVGTLVGMNDAKKMRQLQERLAKMSLAQAKEMEKLMLEAKSDIARQSIMYKTFAVLEEQKLVDDRKNKQLTLLAFMGGGVLVLIGMAIVFKRKR